MSSLAREHAGFRKCLFLAIGSTLSRSVCVVIVNGCKYHYFPGIIILVDFVGLIYKSRSEETMPFGEPPSNSYGTHSGLPHQQPSHSHSHSHTQSQPLRNRPRGSTSASSTTSSTSPTDLLFSHPNSSSFDDAAFPYPPYSELPFTALHRRKQKSSVHQAVKWAMRAILASPIIVLVLWSIGAMMFSKNVNGSHKVVSNSSRGGVGRMNKLRQRMMGDGGMGQGQQPMMMMMPQNYNNMMMMAPQQQQQMMMMMAPPQQQQQQPMYGTGPSEPAIPPVAFMPPQQQQQQVQQGQQPMMQPMPQYGMSQLQQQQQQLQVQPQRLGEAANFMTPPYPPYMNLNPLLAAPEQESQAMTTPLDVRPMGEGTPLIVQPPTQEQPSPLMGSPPLAVAGSVSNTPPRGEGAGTATILYYDPQQTTTDANGAVQLPSTVYDAQGNPVDLARLAATHQDHNILLQPPRGQGQAQEQGLPQAKEAAEEQGLPQAKEAAEEQGLPQAQFAVSDIKKWGESTSQDQSIIVTTVAVMALLVGALSARRLRSRSVLSACIENESLEDDVAYDAAYSTTVRGDSSYNTFGWKGDLEKFDV